MKKKWILLGLGIFGLLVFVPLWYYKAWELIGPFGYCRIELGMTENEIAEILGPPSREYRRSRHIGGITSPGAAEVLFLESGLPFSDLPKRFGDKTRNGQSVTVKQWWGREYAIDIALDENGAAVGLYLMKLQFVNSF